MNAKSLLLLSIFCASGLANAQNCPSGIPSAGNPQCIPPTAQGSPYYQSPAPPQPPRARWQLTWGAIAMDSTTAEIGSSVGHFSRGKAKREAMAICSAKGAKKCKVTLTYKNQCAVVAWPSEIGPGVIAQSGPSIEVASKIALSRCAGYSGSECKIVGSDCTRPVLVYN